MTDLHPEVIAPARARGGPAAQRVLAAIAVDDDVAGPFEVAPVDHHVAGEVHAGAAVRPTSVERLVPLGRVVVGVGQAFGGAVNSGCVIIL